MTLTPHLRLDLPTTDPDPRTGPPLWAQKIIAAYQALDGVAPFAISRFTSLTPNGTNIFTAAAQSAESAAHGEGGGLIVFDKPGIYVLDGLVRYDTDELWVCAPGASVKLADGAVANLIDTALGFTLAGMFQPRAVTGISRIGFVGPFRVDGNKANNTTTNSGDGVDLCGAIDDVVLDVFVTNTARDSVGIVPDANNSANKPTNVRGYVRSVGTGSAGVNGGNGVSVTAGKDIDLLIAVSNCFGRGIDFEPNRAEAKMIEHATARGWVDGAQHMGTMISPANFVDNVVDITIGVRCTNSVHAQHEINAATQDAASGIRYTPEAKAINGQQEGFLNINGRASYHGTLAKNNSLQGAGLYDSYYVNAQRCTFDCVQARGGATAKRAIEEAGSADYNKVVALQADGHTTSDAATLIGTHSTSI